MASINVRNDMQFCLMRCAVVFAEIMSASVTSPGVSCSKFQSLSSQSELPPL